jgi:hypothetical protein
MIMFTVSCTILPSYFDLCNDVVQMACLLKWFGKPDQPLHRDYMKLHVKLQTGGRNQRATYSLSQLEMFCGRFEDLNSKIKSSKYAQSERASALRIKYEARVWLE